MYTLDEDIYSYADRVSFSSLTTDELSLCEKYCIVEYRNTLRVIPREHLSFDSNKQKYSWKGIELPACFHCQLKEQLDILKQFPGEKDVPCSVETQNYVFKYFHIRNFMGICEVLKMTTPETSR